MHPSDLPSADSSPRAAPAGWIAPSVELRDVTLSLPNGRLQAGLSFALWPGLNLLQGGEGSGKTTLLRVLAGELPASRGQVLRQSSTLWYEVAADALHDPVIAQDWLEQRSRRYSHWQPQVAQALVEAFGLQEHLGKPMFMLSAGSRRKVGLVGAAASGADLTLLDTPWAALDGRSGRILNELLEEAAQQAVRCWVIADYACPAGLVDLPWAGGVDLGD